MDIKIVTGSLLGNEELYIKYALKSIYDAVDKIVLVSCSSDSSESIIKENDPENKVIILRREWDNDYASARNMYLDWIKNLYYKADDNSRTYYMVWSPDEIYYDKFRNIKSIINEHLDKESFRFNYYTFDTDHFHLNEVMPEEDRLNIYLFSNEMEYYGGIHETLVKRKGTQLIPISCGKEQDELLGGYFIPDKNYIHLAYCDRNRCYSKAINNTEHYVKQGTETKERFDNIRNADNSWWWTDHKSDLAFKGCYPKALKDAPFLNNPPKGISVVFEE